MQAIRQTVKVKDHKINISLPDDFNADEVDVIILSKENDFILTSEMKAILDTRSKEDKNTFITAEESIERLKRKSGV